MRRPQSLSGSVLWLTLSLLLCKHSSYWVTHYLPQTNRCLIWFKAFNCSVEIIHYTSLTAAFRSSQLCLQVQSLHYSFQTDLCLTAANTKSVLFFCKAAHVVGSRGENTTLSLSATSFILFESYKQTGFIHGKHKEKNLSYLFPLQSAVLFFWAFGVSKGARKGMRAGPGKPLTLPLPLWKMSAFSPRLPEVCISSSVLFISFMWAS